MDKSVLRKALADSDEPTPGYLFREIVQMTFVDHATQAKLIQYLVALLDVKSSVHVLSKTLKVVKHLCEEGHTDFQKEMQRNADLLRQFAAYRGPQDPKFGDKLNEKVRNSAREAIDAAFSHRKEVRIQIASGTGSNTVTAEEKKGFITGAPTTSGQTSAHMAPMPTEVKWGAAGPSAGGSGGFISDVKTGFATGFGLWQENIKSTEQRMAEEMSKGSTFTGIEVPMGGFGGSSGGGAGGSEWKFVADASGAGAAGAAGTAKSETRTLTPFQKEVEKLCAMKSTPQRVDLAQFLTAVQEIAEISEGALSFSDLAADMDDKLAQKQPWQHRLNVMLAVEHLVRNNVHADFAAYFVENPEDIQRNVHVVQTALKERAQKVLKLLGLQERGAAAAEAAAQQLTTATGHGEMTWASSAGTATAAAAPAAGGLDFGDMTVRAAPARATGGRGAGPEAAKTTLKKRATMTVQEEPTPAPAAASGFGTWGATGGTTAPPVAGGFGSWGTTDSSWATPAASLGPVPSTSPAPVASAPAAPKPVDAFDALFGAPSVPAPAVAPSAAAPAAEAWGATPASTATWGVAPAAAPAAPAAWGPPPVAATPSPAIPAVAAPSAPVPQVAAASPVAALQASLMQQMQQTMALMSSGTLDAAQMQQMLLQQQQLMTMMQQLQASAISAPAAAPAAAPKVSSAALEDLNAEMKRSLGY